jgi:hypothetical protein
MRRTQPVTPVGCWFDSASSYNWIRANPDFGYRTLAKMLVNTCYSLSYVLPKHELILDLAGQNTSASDKDCA